jgi:ribosomal protein L21E
MKLDLENDVTDGMLVKRYHGMSTNIVGFEEF